MPTKNACRLAVLAQAKKYVGVKEHPAGSNRGPHIDRWCRWANGLVGYPWCAAFLCGMVREGCGLIVPVPGRASVGFLEAWAKQVGAIVQRPFRGDWVCYNFTTDNWPDHIGVIDRVLAVRWRGGKFVGTIRTIEGNTSAGNDANGGQVQVRWRAAHRCTFIRIKNSMLKRAGVIPTDLRREIR